MSVYTDILNKHNDIMQKVWNLQALKSMHEEETALMKKWLQKKHPDVYEDWCEHCQHYISIIDKKTATVKIKKEPRRR